MHYPTDGNAPAKAEAIHEQGGDLSSEVILTSPDDIHAALSAWRERLAKHVDDPACLAGCQRLGRILGGAR